MPSTVNPENFGLKIFPDTSKNPKIKNKVFSVVPLRDLSMLFHVVASNSNLFPVQKLSVFLIFGQTLEKAYDLR